MSIVKNKDKRTGITYVYESESYWDKEKQQPRSRRTLIGKLDETTGEIVPTDGRGRKRKDNQSKNESDTTLRNTREQELIQKQEHEIMILKDEIKVLKREKATLKKNLQQMLALMDD